MPASLTTESFHDLANPCFGRGIRPGIGIGDHHRFKPLRRTMMIRRRTRIGNRHQRRRRGGWGRDRRRSDRDRRRNLHHIHGGRREDGENRIEFGNRLPRRVRSEPHTLDRFTDIADLQRNQRIAQTKRRSELTTMNDRLLNAFLAGSIDEPTFNAKLAALRDELALIETSLAKVATVDATDVRAALAVFEFSQKIPEIWRGSKMLEKRRILETVSLNRRLGDVSLELEKRKPFDELAKRLEIQLSRDDRI